MNTSNVLFALILVLASAHKAGAQNFEEWKRREQEQFKEYVREVDALFSEFLKSEWEEFVLRRRGEPDAVPKPSIAPTAPQFSSTYEPETSGSPEREAVAIRASVPAAVDSTGLTAPVLRGTDVRKIRFLDRDVGISVPSVPDIDVERPLDGEAFSAVWLQLGTWEHEEVVASLLQRKDDLRLNDFCFFQLVAALTNEVLSDPLHSTLMTWFLMVKCGYDGRICYNKANVYLLLPVQSLLYNCSYLRFGEDGPAYYMFGNGTPAAGVSSVHTYAQAYPEPLNTFSLRMVTPPRISPVTLQRTLSFAYGRSRYDISIAVNESGILAGKSYPLTEIDLYFGSAPSLETRDSLLSALGEMIRGKTEVEAANSILRFVQTSFAYKTDREQFGAEKPFFIEEILFYPYSDCEDRSILFAFLVYAVLELPVIGLDYPGHTATAVKFTTAVIGDAVLHRGDRYVICDPTYINADIGMCMPQFKKETPRVIETAFSGF